MFVSRSLVAVLLSTLALSKPLARDLHVVHEARANAPSGYVLTGPASPETVLNLRVGLVENNVDGLISALYDVSDPSSANYGQHLTQAEANSYLTPTAESASAVNAWLSTNDLTASVISSAGDWLAVDVPVSKANELLGADYSVFTHVETGKQTIRTLSYSIPANLTGHLDLVHPTISFPDPYAKAPLELKRSGSNAIAKRSTDASSPCEEGEYPDVTPDCLLYLYDMPSTPTITPGNGYAVTEYIEQWATYADLKTYLEDFRPDMSPDTAWIYQSIDGGINPQNESTAGVEAELDVQYAIGLTTDVPVTFISVGGDFLTGLLDTALTLLNETAPPQVMSTSYGDDEDDVSEAFAYKLCNAYAALGARGVSVVYASGDGGVSGGHFDPNCTTFLPVFPAACPYVTSVGATNSLPTQTATYFSGGGFSNYWTRPLYQEGAVAGYLARLGANNTGLYNPSGRGYPDVAAYGVNFDVVYAGEVTPVSGTSCSSPTFGSVIALLNARLLAAGRPTLGFLNPFLYTSGIAGLTDITTGSNLACSNYTTGFYASEGWDPITGLGTPNFANLLTAVGL
ncbi:hypothetical protein POSPLADRAFT_1044231 [Postia placenta MAD-698-R-SB12]|uniref:tripeptidyl-peptidase II n=1 Tax=Postia placenta MAD-698-R-SB12 TaxID=670580 RepID=A0A1X6N8J0_9APHY|nr:hypothetical protein POSPLADRAFT_1044231 [Postia placenta MAD-698-R-SB12]OSX64776.1 hypothetical protein POSPLADRAFT_1044231 [Postia placenta MAD-698-R-SB12]